MQFCVNIFSEHFDITQPLSSVHAARVVAPNKNVISVHRVAEITGFPAHSTDNRDVFQFQLTCMCKILSN